MVFENYKLLSLTLTKKVAASEKSYVFYNNKSYSKHVPILLCFL
jgi:hypothetical protein